MADRLTANQLFGHLMASGWKSFGRNARRMAWLAARYYTGVESLADLRQHTQSRPVSDDYCLRPMLSQDEFQTIIDLR